MNTIIVCTRYAWVTRIIYRQQGGSGKGNLQCDRASCLRSGDVQSFQFSMAAAVSEVVHSTSPGRKHAAM